MTDFTGKRCIVTGAGQGIGRAIALELSRRGAQVIAISRTAAHLETLATEASGIQTLICDVTNLDELRGKIQPHLPVHMLVNNAGTNVTEKFLDVTQESFHKILDLNFTSAFFLTQWVIKSMIENNIKGSIVNISSQASKVFVPQHVIYSASKAAVDNFTAYLACEFGSNGIRINAINPTVVMTELAKRYWGDPARAEGMLSKIPLRQFADLADVVKAVIYLLSDDSKMITGVCLPVDGGASAM